MDSSDDEVDTAPKYVSNYSFEYDDGGPISFSVLPVKWSKNESIDAKQRQQVFLRGLTDNGQLSLYTGVTAWKFDLLNASPEISVLTKQNSWIKLDKPRKSFEETVMPILVTVHCLHYTRRKPEVSKKSLWDCISKIFGSYQVRASQNDLVGHMALIKEAVKRDGALAMCKYLCAFLKEKPTRMPPDKVALSIPMTDFIVDHVDGDNDEVSEEDQVNQEDDLFDSVCAFCDNGGNLLCCDGSCLRSFHPTKEYGCETLGFTKKEVDAIQNFYCKNCELKQHQCFACGKLGYSDKDSGAEVFRCINGTCGHFYHPHCVAKLLHPKDEAAAEELGEKIAAGDAFACPMHKCCVCKQVENKDEKQLQFALCRRCPTAYHRKCLPRQVAFGDLPDEGIITRAWDGLLPKRVLIYCLNHEIYEDLGTPSRDHIKFPVVEEKKTVIRDKRKKQELELCAREGKSLLKKRRLNLGDSLLGDSVLDERKKLSSAAKEVEIPKKVKPLLSAQDSSSKMRANNGPKISLKGGKSSVLMHSDRSAAVGAKKTSIGDRLYDLTLKSSEQPKPGRKHLPGSKLYESVTVKSATKKLISEPPPIDADTERRLLNLIKNASSKITLEDIVKKYKAPSTHVYSSKAVIDKTITTGKVEGAVEAVRTALKKLEEGYSIDDAKAVCEPEVVNQIFKWKDKLKVYLGPFLHGMRYTSFGRHFTKVEKLEEIVNMLHFYVQDGDMVVDFCCGANDFSCLMKRKLEEMGKNCFYKNYDIVQPKNDFNFEKRDWMTVCPNELPKGSQLVMGLNPPFGINGTLANKFVDKALEFKPKLLILIVPPETQRLEQKNPPYDLVWENNLFLSGKSFYLPGSVDEDGKQMDQWNNTAPVLYLWSRCDWSAKHKTIAQKHGPLSGVKEATNLERGKLNRMGMAEGCEVSSPNELSLHAEVVQTGHQRLEPSSCGSRGFGTAYCGNQVTNNDTSRMYIMNNNEPYSLSVHIPSSGANLEDQCAGRVRQSAENSYTTYISELERESDIWSQARPSGRGFESSAQRNSLLGPDLGYGQMGSMPPMPYRRWNAGVESAYRMNMPAMQRYAPRLDELSHTRMSGFCPEPPPWDNRKGIYDPRAPQPGYHFDSMGFAQGPYQPYPHNSSAGWIDWVVMYADAPARSAQSHDGFSAESVWT